MLIKKNLVVFKQYIYVNETLWLLVFPATVKIKSQNIYGPILHIAVGEWGQRVRKSRSYLTVFQACLKVKLAVTIGFNL